MSNRFIFIAPEQPSLLDLFSVFRRIDRDRIVVGRQFNAGGRFNLFHLFFHLLLEQYLRRKLCRIGHSSRNIGTQRQSAGIINDRKYNRVSNNGIDSGTGRCSGRFCRSQSRIDRGGGILGYGKWFSTRGHFQFYA